ncbi:MAG: hypothetical protein E6G92_12505 [Alphaproteobacteria bacterium]|nr:MAG: hypothetical protein E6G92_12505 [Alphaproteobacteria bacterium]
MTGPVSACWRADDARSIFVTEALEGNDAIFLATHTPIEGFDVAGRDAGEFAGSDEQAVLDTLSDETRQHAFCVVQGEPGSGKSHLIRWLSVNWPHANDIKLLLRRVDGSLEGALGQLKDRLPEEFLPLFDNLGQRQRASSQGRANIFLSTLVNTLEPGHFDEPLPDEGWCRQYHPAELLGTPAIRANWKAPSRILNLLEGAGGDRNSATASFDLYDIDELAALAAPLNGSAAIAHSQALARKLVREAEDIRAFREQDWLPDELAQEYPDRFETSLRLIDALNRRRNDAIQNVLGVSAQGLKTLFRQVREALAERGGRLVLLLEDITSWEGLDDSLIDVLVFNAGAKGDQDKDVCPLISVVGVTPAYYEKLAANYKQRITHEIWLGHSTGGLQDVATLRDSEIRRQFATRYLAAVRAGPAALEAWLLANRSGEDAPPPNPCDACPRQDACFATFGAEHGVGLFPFTAHALDRFFEALKENDNGQTWKTPRGILQAILNPNLIRPDTLAAGTYPTATVEPDVFRQDRRSNFALSNRLEQFVANRIDSGPEQARMRRVLSYWADPERTDTTLVDGEFAFAGARRGLYEAFGLPWLGGDTVTSEATSATAPPPAENQPVLPELQDPEEETAPDTPVPGRPDAPRPVQPLARAPKPKRLTPNKSELEQLREQIRSWAAGGTIDNPSRWNQLLYALIDGIDARRLGAPAALVKRVITSEMVKLQGSTSGARDYLVIDAEPWVRNGLEAYLSLRADGRTSGDEADFHRRNLAAMMRGLQRSAAQYLDRRVPTVADGARWSPVTTFAQILLARAWLRGATTADAPIVEQIRAVLSDETGPESDVAGRSTPWQDWLNATNKAQDPLRTHLRTMVGLAISDGSGGAPLTDSSELAGAIVRFRETASFDPFPDSDGRLPEPFRRARELAQMWRDRRSQIERTEFGQLSNRAQALGDLLRNKSVAAHLERLDLCIIGISDLLPTAAADRVTNWRMTYTSLQARLEDGAGRRAENLILALEADEVPPKMPLKLSWLASAPARDLEELLFAAQLGEKVVEALLEHARDCVHEASGTGSLAQVRAAGNALQVAVGARTEGTVA